MEPKQSTHLSSELERRILDRTGRRIRHLAIEVSPERVILRGQTYSYYLKQLAQHGVLELLPHVPLENTIAVENRARFELASV